MAIQQKYQKKNEEVYRVQQQIIGFIPPDNMQESDWLFSFATNKQDEDAILENVKAYEREKVQSEDLDEDLDEASDNEEKENADKEFDLTGYFIIKHEGYFSMIWTVFDILCCLASSYIYLWLATFGEDQKAAGTLCYPDMNESQREQFNKDASSTYTLVLAFEIIFLISIITKFLTDFRPDGETEHVKSLTKISSRYLHGDFLSDFIPLIPLTFIFKNYFC